MFYMCAQKESLTNLNISWSEVLEMPVRYRNKFLEMLFEVRSKEEQAIRTATSKARMR